MNWETYIAFGDSITLGARSYLGYPELVGKALSAHLSKYWNVVNHAVCGMKAIDLARDIDRHFPSLREQRSNVSTILIGTNDIKEKTSAGDYEVALSQIILKAKLLTGNKNVILLTIPEFHKGIAYPYSFDMNEQVTIFNGIIRSQAEKNGLRTLCIEHTEDDFFDGVHLNATGVVSFSNQIAKCILKDKGFEL